jgi:hypothetical protein
MKTAKERMIEKYEKEVKVITDPMSNEKYIHVDFVNFLLKKVESLEDSIKRLKWIGEMDKTAKKILKEVNCE